jgi:hypothetical protein
MKLMSLPNTKMAHSSTAPYFSNSPLVIETFEIDRKLTLGEATIVTCTFSTSDDSPTNIRDITFVGANSGDITLSGFIPDDLTFMGYNHFEVTLTILPSASYTSLCEMKISHLDWDSLPTVSTIILRLDSKERNIVMFSPDINFGGVTVGESATQSVTLTNTATLTPLAITSFKVFDSYLPSEIEVPSLNTLTPPINIPPGGTISFECVYSPLVNTSRASYVQLETSDGTYDFSIVGMGVNTLGVSIPPEMTSLIAVGTTAYPIEMGVIQTVFVNINSTNETFMIESFSFLNDTLEEFEVLYPDAVRYSVIFANKPLLVAVKYTSKSTIFKMPELSISGIVLKM